MRLLAAALAIVACLLSPLAAAEDTLATFQEPHSGTDQVWAFTVTSDESRNLSAVVFLNPLSSPFEILVYAENGTTMFHHKGPRGVQSLDPLAPGHYRFFVRGKGAFVVTQHFLDTVRNVTVTDANRTLQSPTEAWVLAPRQPWRVFVNGTASVEWDDLAAASVEGSAKHLTPPVNQTTRSTKPALILVHGEPGDAYTIHLEPAPDAADASTPTPTVAKTPLPALLVPCAALIALAARRLAGRRP